MPVELAARAMLLLNGKAERRSDIDRRSVCAAFEKLAPRDRGNKGNGGGIGVLVQRRRRCEAGRAVDEAEEQDNTGEEEPTAE